MKKIYLSIVAAVSLMFVSCTADWLNTDPSTAVQKAVPPAAEKTAAGSCSAMRDCARFYRGKPRGKP